MSLIHDSIAAFLGSPGTGNSYLDSSSNKNHAAFIEDVVGGAKPSWSLDATLGRYVLSTPANAAGHRISSGVYSGWMATTISFADVVPRSGQFAIAMWCYGVVSNDYFLCGNRYSNTAPRGWSLGMDSYGRPMFYVGGSSGYDRQWCDNSEPCQASQWNSIIVNADITSNNVDIYVNGSEPTGYFDVLDFTAVGDWTSYWRYMHIGTSALSTSIYSGGNPANLTLGPMIFDRLLTSGEISTLQTVPDVPSVAAGGLLRVNLNGGI